MLDAEVNGGKEAVFHEDDISTVAVGDDELSRGIEEGGVALDDEALPAGVSEETLDFRVGGRFSGDGRLADQEAQAGVGLECAKEDHLISKNFIVKLPALQIGDGRGIELLVGTVDDEQAEEARPSSLDDRFGAGEIPDLVLVALVVGRSFQFGRRLCEVETGFTPASELVNASKGFPQQHGLVHGRTLQGKGRRSYW